MLPPDFGVPAHVARLFRAFVSESSTRATNCVAFAFLCVVFVCHANAQSADTSSDALVTTWNEFYADRIASYAIELSGDSDQRLVLRPQPLLTYTNPVRGRDQHGSIFVWTLDGVPAVVGSIWSIAHLSDPTRRRTAHELHSLCDSSIQASCAAFQDPLSTQANTIAWTLDPHVGAVELQSKTIQSPVDSASRRLLQMRRIAQAFSAITIDRQGNRQTLRLMTTPLMRYSVDRHGIVDGTLFALVHATDPELLVAIEAAEDSDTTIWRVRAARFTGIGIRLKLEDQEIWRCKPINYKDQTGPYRLRVGVSDLPSDPSRLSARR